MSTIPPSDPNSAAIASGGDDRGLARFSDAISWVAVLVTLAAGVALVLGGVSSGPPAQPRGASFRGGMSLANGACFILAAVALRLANVGRKTAPAFAVCAGLVILLGVLPLAGSAIAPSGTAGPGHGLSAPVVTSHPTFALGLGFVLTGSALLALRWKSAVAQYLVFPLALVAAVSLLGYFFDEPAIYAIGQFTTLTPVNALLFAILAAGLVCAIPGGGPFAIAFSAGESGATFRRLLFAAGGTSLLLTRGTLALARAGYFSPSYGLALAGTVGALFLLGILWANALIARLQERRRDELEGRVRQQWSWYEITLSSIGDAVIAASVDGRITFLNERACALTGWGFDQALGRPYQEVFEVVDEMNRRPLTNPIGKALRSGAVVGFTERTILIARDGTDRYITHSAAPITDDKGVVSGVVLAFRDATAERRAQDALERADLRKNEFLAMLAHELRNPLGAINNAVHLLEQPNVDGNLAWSREVLARQVGNLSRLVEDLLDVSRITSGKIEIRTQVIDPVPVLNAAVSVVQPLIRQRQHVLTVAKPSENLAVEVDPTRLEQILVNLFSNAAKYTDTGGRIDVAVSRDNEDVVFRVRDNGAGIRAEQIPHIFDLFVQGDRALARSEGGLGIGLTLVRRLAELHGGSISASSAGAGEGSEFILRLPASAHEPAPEPALTSPPPRAGTGAAASRVLVVDDNVDMARGLSRLLRRQGHIVRVEHDGVGALTAAKEFDPEYILLDIGLPSMDGYEVVTRLRRDEQLKNTLIVAVSGYGQDSDIRRSILAGFDHHLVKPVDPDAILRLVRKTAAPRSAHS